MRPQRGSILIVVLFILAVLSLVVLSLAYQAHIESRLARDRARMLQLRSHARSAAAVAMAALAADENDFDHPAEPWQAHPPLAEQGGLPQWQIGPGEEPDIEIDYQVIDEEGKLNVLYASSDALEKIGMPPGQIACLFDWMDADDVTRSEGAEDGVYARRDPPGRCKDAPIETLEELLLIHRFGRDALLGEDADNDGKLDPNEDDGPDRPPADNADGRLQIGWLRRLTCLGDGRINLNTAARAVLETLPLSDGAVDQILGYRRFDEHSSGRLQDHAFRSSTDIDQLQGLSDTDREVLHGSGRFRSDHYRIHVQCHDRKTGLRCALEVLVRRDGSEPAVLQWQWR